MASKSIPNEIKQQVEDIALTGKSGSVSLPCLGKSTACWRFAVMLSITAFGRYPAEAKALLQDLEE